MIDSSGANGRKRPRRRAVTTGRVATAFKAAALPHAFKSSQSAGAIPADQISFASAPNGLGGMAASLTDLFDAFQKLAADPANFARRVVVVRNAQKIVIQFNRASSQLRCLETELNVSIQGDVVEANQNLAAIAGLNGQILGAQSMGGTVNALAARRAQCLETLLGHVNVLVTFNPDSTINVIIDSVTMVTGTQTPDNIATYPDPTGNLQIQAQESGIRLKLADGSIAGKIAARDGGLASLQRGLNLLASQLIVKVNTIYSATSDLNSRMTGEFFTGACASDIGVNSAVANDPIHLQPNTDMPDMDTQTFLKNYAKTVSELGDTLSTVNDDLISSQVVTKMLAKNSAPANGSSRKNERADLQHYERAYAVSEQVITALNDMTPVQ